MPPERILKQPVAPLPLLPLQELGVAKLAGADAQVPAHGEEVEADLRGRVAGDAALQHVDDLRGEGLRGAGAVRDGRLLEAVELVEHAVDGRVRDEVEDVLAVAARPRRLVRKGRAPREAIVHLADQVRVAQRLPAELGRQLNGKLAKVAHRAANVHALGRLVQQDRQQRLRRARVLDGLHGEEDALRGVVVKGAVEGPRGRCVGLVGRVFEEEDDAIEGLEGEEL